MRFLIVGTAWIAECFKKAVDLSGEAECVAVYSRTQESGMAFCKKTGIKTLFTSLEDAAMFDGADAVYIASPNSCHYHQSKLMLQSGKHVFCEKPITGNAAEFEELYSLAKSKNLLYLQALMTLHNPSFFLLKNELKNIGKITGAHLDFSQLSSKYQSFLSGENPNVFNPRMLGGSLMDLGVYNISLCIRLFGYPKKIIGSLSFLENGVDGAGDCVFRYDDFNVTISFSKIGQSRTKSQIIGDCATLTLGSVSKLTDISRFDTNGNEFIITEDSAHEEVMKFEVLNFVEASKDKEKYAEFLDECYDVSYKTIKAINEIKKL